MRGKHEFVSKAIEGTVYFRHIAGTGESWLKIPFDMANVSVVLSFSNFIALHYPDYSTLWVSLIPLAIVLWIASVFTLGRILDRKYKAINVAAKFGTDRNPALIAIKKGISRIEEQLKKE
ncbi:MAG: hypothetical protein ACYS6W_14650 [Planctomycetota bacterium]